MTIFDRVRSPPPPRPWTARPAISISIEIEVALKVLPTKKMLMAMRSTGLRPHMSLTLPQIGVEAPSASIYAAPTQTYASVEWKWLEIVGKAVVTMVISSAARKVAH